MLLRVQKRKRLLRRMRRVLCIMLKVLVLQLMLLRVQKRKRLLQRM
jgi:hypothetical protein